MKKDTKQSVELDEKQAYLLEVASKYDEQLKYLNAKKDRVKRFSILYGTTFGLLGIIASYVTRDLIGSSFYNLLTTMFVAYVAIFIAFYYLQYSSVQSKINQTLNRMRVQEKLSGSSGVKPSIADNEEYFSKLVEINIDNLSAYYEQVKSHANKSFLTSLMMSILGFIIILAGLIVSFNSQDQRTLLIFVSTGSGIITEIIAALFFYLYTQTVHQMKSYHDGLLYVQNILLSMKLIEGIEGADAKLKAESINKLIEYLLKQQRLSEK